VIQCSRSGYGTTAVAPMLSMVTSNACTTLTAKK